MPIDERLKEGIQLFNNQQFFECHEIIENLWLETKDESRNFLKGLIQAAVAVHHFKKENLSGALGLYKSSTQYLSSYSATYSGVNAEKLIRGLNVCFRELVQADDGATIQIREELIPKIQFEETLG